VGGRIFLARFAWSVDGKQDFCLLGPGTQAIQERPEQQRIGYSTDAGCVGDPTLWQA